MGAQFRLVEDSVGSSKGQLGLELGHKVGGQQQCLGICGEFFTF